MILCANLEGHGWNLVGSLHHLLIMINHFHYHHSSLYWFLSLHSFIITDYYHYHWCPPSPSEARTAREPCPRHSCHRMVSPEAVNVGQCHDKDMSHSWFFKIFVIKDFLENDKSISKPMHWWLWCLSNHFLRWKSWKWRNLVDNVHNVQRPNKENTAFVGRVRRNLEHHIC